jgi:hypothetical protein
MNPPASFCKFKENATLLQSLVEKGDLFILFIFEHVRKIFEKWLLALSCPRGTTRLPLDGF